MKPVSTLYIGFKNQTHGSVYELPESTEQQSNQCGSQSLT